MSVGDREPARAVVRDGAAWRIGTDADVSWIQAGTDTGVSITSAIPPVFDDYATVVLPDEDPQPEGRPFTSEHDEAVRALLERHTRPQPWWLGYLDTGGRNLGFHEAQQVTLYADWRYLLVEARPDQSAPWQVLGDQAGWKGTGLPDLIFPQDRSWLLSTLWDDDWTCIGGPQALIADLLTDQVLGSRARRVLIDQDATPPGHIAR